MWIHDMAIRDKIDLNTISEIDYIVWYVECWFKQNPDYNWLSSFEYVYLSTNNAIRETFNSVFCDAHDSYGCDIDKIRIDYNKAIGK